MGFPKTVSYQPAPAVEGDFCDANPRASVNAGPGGLFVGPAGAVIGRFCWATAPNDADGAPASVTNSGTGPVTGFLHREQQGLITAFLAESGMTMQPGFPVTLMKSGGFWARNAGAGAASKGQKAFAKLADGSVVFGAAGAVIADAVETKFIAMSAGAAGELVKISSQPEG